MTKTDIQLKRDIEMELSWDPKINAAQVGVSVDKGVVSLMGEVDTYAEKWAAEDATKRVSGVRTISEELKVKISSDDKHSDSEIAGAVQNALKWNVFVPDSVNAKVTKGLVTLEGQVQWHFERKAAEKVARHIAGVLNVHNEITLKAPPVSTEDVKAKVLAALQRQATSDANDITVESSGGQVTLSGHASSLRSIDDAADAAWAAPGVTNVIERVTIH